MSAKVKTFESLRDIRPHVLREGITARAVEGERMTMAVVDLVPNLVMPAHHHENEQLGFIIAGSMVMRIGNEERELRPGDTYSIPSNVSHDVVAGPDGATVVDVFAPVRADWREMKRLDPHAPRWP
ncbi:MAG TPA: cupin domain-containing protein [Candidatus Nitrosotalea sp.]|nr:cupin domain-containing protein [Candidatus Nitrosotalea sp.]